MVVHGPQSLEQRGAGKKQEQEASVPVQKASIQTTQGDNMQEKAIRRTKEEEIYQRAGE
jgi:hypothetical protein